MVILDNIEHYAAEYPAFFEYVNFYELSDANSFTTQDISAEFSFFAFGDEPIIKILFTNDPFPDMNTTICEVGNFA